jgi:hypothetical protein
MPASKKIGISFPNQEGGFTVSFWLFTSYIAVNRPYPVIRSSN